MEKELHLLEDDDCVEDKGSSLPEDVEYGVEKEWNLLEDDDCVEDGNEDVREDLQEHKLQPQYVHRHVRRVLKREGLQNQYKFYLFKVRYIFV